MVAHGGVQWTQQRVADLAPDAASLRAARTLARPGPWSATGSSGDLLWGRCQGSGATPYQVTVELDGPVIRCSCPSRKQPCKHGLALLLVWVTGGGQVQQVADAPPADARAQARSDAAATAATRSAVASAPADPAAQAKRLARRLQLMTDGLAELERWLADMVRDGLAAARRQPYGYWDGAAARLVDAQLPGLARRVRDMPGQLATRPDWPDHLLGEAGRWYLAARAWAARDDLDEADRADLRTYLGWARPAEEVIAGQRIRDRWLVLGVHRTDDGPVVEQRTWLQGLGTDEVGMVLDFAGAGATLQTPQVVGAVIDTDVARYPGHPPARLRFVADPVATGRARPPAATTLAEGLARAAQLTAANPWLDRVPLVLDRTRLVIGPDGVVVVDAADHALPTVGVDLLGALAVTGGHEVTMVAELQRGRLRPLSATLDDRLVPL